MTTKELTIYLILSICSWGMVLCTYMIIQIFRSKKRTDYWNAATALFNTFQAQETANFINSPREGKGGEGPREIAELFKSVVENQFIHMSSGHISILKFYWSFNPKHIIPYGLKELNRFLDNEEYLNIKDIEVNTKHENCHNCGKCEVAPIEKWIDTIKKYEGLVRK